MERFGAVLRQSFLAATVAFLLLGEMPAYAVFLFLLIVVPLVSNPHMSLKVVNTMIPLDRPFIVASECASLDAPGNTLAAAREVIRKGGKAIHFQATLTSDHIPVVFGDRILDNSSNGMGRVSQATYNFVSKLSVSAGHPSRLYPDEKIPSVEKMMTLCMKHSVTMVIELIGDPHKLMRATRELYAMNLTLYRSILVVSDQPYLIYLLRRNVPKAMTGLIFRHRRPPKPPQSPPNAWRHVQDLLTDWWFKYWLWYVCGYSFVLLDGTQVSESLVAYYRRLGIVTVVGPVRRPEEVGYFSSVLNCPVLTQTMELEGFDPLARVGCHDNVRVRSRKERAPTTRGYPRRPKVTSSDVVIPKSSGF